MRCSGLPSVCRGHKWTTYLRVAGVTLLTLGFCVLFWWLSSSGYFFIFLDWVKRIGYWGNLLFVGAFTLDGLPFMLFGYTPLGLAAGFIYGQYGPVWGIINATVTVSLGTVTGSILGFWSCRKLFKEWFQEKVRQNPTLQAFMSVMESHGFKLVLIMRMAPIPFGVQNGLFSISNISGMSFAMATLIGLFPEILMLVYMGTTMRDLSEIASGDFKFGIRQKIMLGIEIAMTVILCVLLFFLSRQAMQKVKQKQLEASINTDPEDVTALSLADEASDNETARTEDADGDRTPHQNGAVNSDDDMELGDNGFALTPIHTSIAGGGAVVPSIRKKRHEDLLEKAKEPAQNDIELVDGNAEERWNPFEESHPQEQPHWAKQKEIVA